MTSAYRHLAFTGTKEGMTASQLSKLRRELERLRDDGFLWMHNGDCIGSDAEAARLWKKELGKSRLMLHPPIKDKFRAHIPYADITCEPKDYLARDVDMVICSELLIATPLTYDEQQRSGTWTTVRYARKCRLRRIIIFPDGSNVKE